jgi:hypothetical protein
MPSRWVGYFASGRLGERALRRIGLLSIAIILAARGVLIVNALRTAEPVATAFDEDAYFGFAVARNVAAGNGVVAGHGEPTNGFQPLWTFLLVPVYALAGSDRAVFASVYAVSTALWLAAAWLFAGLVARHAESEEPDLAGVVALACFALFLADPRLSEYFFNGLETGCYIAGLLLFWRWLVAERPLGEPASWRRGAAFGLLLGGLLLVRNDAILVAPFLLAAGAYRGRRSLPRLALAAGLAAAVFSPWVIYNYELGGTIQPQSGRSTMIRAGASWIDGERASGAVRTFLEQTSPPDLLGITKLPGWCLAAFAIVLCAGFTWLWRREPRAKLLARSAVPLAGASAAMIAYYTLFSRATWMYPRYFVLVRLLSMAAWSLLLVAVLQAWRAERSSIAAIVLLAAAATNTVHTARWDASTNAHMGDELGELLAAGLCDGPARVGMFDSGRSGYRCTPYVFNLDGKASLLALHALEQHRLLDHLAAVGIDQLFLREDLVPWFDTVYPQWRQQFSIVAAPPKAVVFARNGATDVRNR